MLMWGTLELFEPADEAGDLGGINMSYEFKKVCANGFHLYEKVHNPQYCSLEWHQHEYNVFNPNNKKMAFSFGCFRNENEPDYVMVWNKGKCVGVDLPNANEICTEVLEGRKPFRWLKRLVMKKKKNEDKRRFS